MCSSRACSNACSKLPFRPRFNSSRDLCHKVFQIHHTACNQMRLFLSNSNNRSCRHKVKACRILVFRRLSSRFQQVLVHQPPRLRCLHLGLAPTIPLPAWTQPLRQSLLLSFHRRCLFPLFQPCQQVLNLSPLNPMRPWPNPLHPQLKLNPRRPRRPPPVTQQRRWLVLASRLRRHLVPRRSL